MSKLSVKHKKMLFDFEFGNSKNTDAVYSKQRRVYKADDTLCIIRRKRPIDTGWNKSPLMVNVSV